MITIVIAAMLAGGDPGSTSIQHFVQCLHDSDADAKSQKIAPDTYTAFARQHCASAASPYQASLISEDVKHGMSHKEAVSDAASIIDSYYSERLDNYKVFYKSNLSVADDKSPASPPKVTPAPTPASQPK